MQTNAAIIGVGQSAYTRRPDPGQSTHTFIRDAVVAALKDAEIDAREIDGMALASFSLAPDAAVDLAWKLGLSLRWLVQDTNGGSSAMNMLGHALRGVESGRPSGDLGRRRRRHRARRLRQGGGELQHRDTTASRAARSRRAERRLCAGDQPADEDIRPAKIRLRPASPSRSAPGRRKIRMRSIGRR